MNQLSKKIYKMKNPEKIVEYNSSYYQKNRERILAKAKKRPKRKLSELELEIKRAKKRFYMKNRRAKNKVGSQ